MKTMIPLLALGVLLSQAGCKSENQQREQDQAKQARAEADEKAFAIARETEHKTRLINDEIARKEAEVKKQAGEEKAEAQRELEDTKRSAEKDKQALVGDAANRIAESQRSAEREEGQAYSALPEARAEAEARLRREFEQIEQRATQMKTAYPAGDPAHAKFDGIITQSKQARNNLQILKTAETAAYRSNRATLEKQVENLKASLGQQKQ